jgi:hypothetical protein
MQFRPALLPRLLCLKDFQQQKLLLDAWLKAPQLCKLAKTLA